MAWGRSRCDAIRGDELARPVHHRDCPLIARIGLLGPRHQAVVGENHSLVLGEFAHHLAQFETGTQPIDVRETLAQSLQGHRAAFGVVGERADRVCMHMIDVPKRQEGVQQRLDRRPPRCGIEQRTGDQIGHLLITHFPTITQSDELSQPQPGIVVCHGPPHIRTRALDPHHLLLAAEMIDDHPLGRRVAASIDHEGWISADPIRSLNEIDQRRIAHRAPTS